MGFYLELIFFICGPANGGLTFNGAIVARGMGYGGPFYSDSVGSCCHNSGYQLMLLNTFHQKSASSYLGGVFTPQKICSDSCGVFRSCCVDGFCYNRCRRVCLYFFWVEFLKTAPVHLLSVK
jgi:hypothetical protein